MKMSDEESLLRKMGVDLAIASIPAAAEWPGRSASRRTNTRCRKRWANAVLLPAVRKAPETLIVSDGFSCREQILQATGRRAMHLAEALQLALRSHAPPV